MESVTSQHMPTALVTGVSGAIGAAIAAALAHTGHRVLTVNRSPGRGDDHLVADLGEPDAAVTVAQWAGRRVDHLDVLVNNAALSRKLPLSALTVADFDDIVAVNLRSPLFLIKELRGLLEPGASVVNISSIRATRGFADDVAYQAAKGGLEAMTRALAVELAGEVRINAVAPGAVVSAMNRAVLADPRATAKVEARIPLGRFGDPREVASGVMAMVTNPFITGQVLTIDGGQTIAG